MGAELDALIREVRPDFVFPSNPPAEEKAAAA
jgi:hypothetical protein